MRSYWKYVTVGFVIGLLIGGFLGRTLHPRWFHRDRSPEEWFERKLHRLSSKLDLTPQQQQEVRAILQSKRQQMEALHSETRPKFDVIREKTADDIRKQLNPDQQARFQELRRRFEERRKKHHPPFSF